MGFEIGRVDHDGLLICRLSGQSFEEPGEHAHLAPALLAIVERLRWAVSLRRIAPSQPIAIDEDYPAKNAPIIDTRLPMAPRKVRSKPRHLLVA